MSSKPTYTLSYSSMLTEDYMHTDSIEAWPGASRPLATFLNSQGQSEALVVYEDKELCHLQREPLSSSGWNFCGIGAVIDSIAAANSGNVWIIGSDHNIWMSNAGQWNFVGTLDGGAPRISVGLDGATYAVINQGGNYHLFKFDPSAGSFREQGIVPYGGAFVGKPGSFWTISGGQLFTNSFGPWHRIDVDVDRGEVLVQLSMGNDGSLWIRCESGSIYSYDTQKSICRKLPGVPSDVFGLAAANAQTLYVLNKNFHEQNRLFTNSSGAWKEVSSPAGTSLQEISAGSDGALWARDEDGRAWLYLNDVWIRQIMPTDMWGSTGGHAVTEVVTGKQNNGGVQYAFFISDKALYWSRLVKGTGAYGSRWLSPVNVPGDISHLTVVNDPTGYQLLVYGVSSRGNFVLVQDKGNDQWTATEVPMRTSLSDVSFQFVFDGSWLTYALVNGQLWVGKGSLTSPANSLSAAKTSGAPAKLQTLIPFNTSWYGMSGTLLAAIDSQGQVWLLNGGSGTVYFTQLSNSAVAGIGSVQGAVAMLRPVEGARIYARDKNNMLWVIRQTGTIANKAPQPNTIVWSEWHPLGNDCFLLATGCTIPPPDAPYAPPVDLFSLDSGYEVNVLSEDPVTGALSDLVMLKPDGTNSDATYVTRYVTEVTILDENSTPQPNVEVAMTASEAIGIWVGNKLYAISSELPAHFTTNESGRVTFAFFAADLHTPTFSFKADGLNNAPSVYAAREVNDYLAGSQTAMPNRQRFTADGSALLDAQMQTKPGWETKPIDFVSKENRGNAPKAAGAISDIYGMAVSSNGESGQWSVAAAQPTGMSASSFWHDLCKFPHDIAHAIKKAALKVRDIVVNVRDKVVEFTLELANGLSQVLHLAINTFKDVVSAVKSVFRYIERGIEHVIDWLKALFNWTDILNSKRVVEASLNGLMTKLAGHLDPKLPGYAGTLLDQYFGDLETSILNGFDRAKARFSKTQSISGVANSAPYPESARPIGNDPLNPTSTSNAQSSNGAQTNYVHTHVTNYSSQGGSFPPSAMGDGGSGDSVLKVLFDAIEKNLAKGKFQDEQMRTVESFKSIFSDPKNFANVVVYDIITAMEDLVDILLKVVQGVLDALISLAGNAVRGFQNLMNAPIDIPVISYIYKQISKHPLTMLDLFSLLIAAPSTILYKLTFGLPHAKPPFTEQQTNDIVTELSNPATFPWPAMPGAEVAASSLSGGAFDSSDALYAFIPALALGSALIDMGNDLMAKEAAWPAGNPLGFSDGLAFFGSCSSILLALANHFYGAPFSLFQKKDHTKSEALQITSWTFGFAPIGLNIAFTIASKKLAKFNDKYGVIATSAFGLILLALGLAASGVELQEHFENGADINVFQVIENVVAPLPTTMALLLKFGATATLVLVALDGICDAAGGVLSLLSALNSNDSGVELSVAT